MKINKGKLDYAGENDKEWWIDIVCEFDSGGQWVGGDYIATLTLNGKIYEIKVNVDATIDSPHYKVNSNNYFEYIGYHHTEKLINNKGIKLFMSTNPNLIFKIADVEYYGSNTFEYLNGCGYYNVVPKPESCTTLFTNYNIQTSGVVIWENIESHMFVLNSLGNTVDVALNDISQLQNYCKQLESQIESMSNKVNWFDILQGIVDIGTMLIGFGPGLMRIGAAGIESLSRLSFAKSTEK